MASSNVVELLREYEPIAPAASPERFLFVAKPCSFDAWNNEPNLYLNLPSQSAPSFLPRQVQTTQALTDLRHICSSIYLFTCIHSSLGAQAVAATRSGMGGVWFQRVLHSEFGLYGIQNTSSSRNIHVRLHHLTFSERRAIMAYLLGQASIKALVPTISRL